MAWLKERWADKDVCFLDCLLYGGMATALVMTVLQFT